MILVGGCQSREIDIGVRLFQSSILSPVLFNVYKYDLPKALGEWYSGLNIYGTEVNILLYADYIVLVTSWRSNCKTNITYVCETQP